MQTNRFTIDRRGNCAIPKFKKNIKAVQNLTFTIIIIYFKQELTILMPFMLEFSFFLIHFFGVKDDHNVKIKYYSYNGCRCLKRYTFSDKEIILAVKKYLQ